MFHHNDRLFLIIRGGQKQYEILDYIKGFSITTIVLMHLIQSYITLLPGSVRTAASLGGTGVHLFIFCSGFGLYRSFLKRRTSFREFIKRRLIKIYLTYILVIVISFFIPFIYNKPHRILALLSHIFLFKMFIPEFECSFGGQFWFISTIIQFYLAFIPLCRVMEKCKRRLFIFICAGISVIWWLFLVMTGLNDNLVCGYFFLQFLWEFALGMGIADLLNDNVDLKIHIKLLVICGIVGLCLQATLAYKGGAFKVVNDVPAFVGYGSIVLLFYCFNILKSFFLKVNLFSYEWYLVHILIFTCSFELSKPSTLAQQLVVGTIALLISILIAIIYQYAWNNLYQKALVVNK